jgi:Cu+-exporting ATPase
MKVIDPVCGMPIESEQAAASESYQGRSFYFCSPNCHRSFKADPAKFAANAAPEPAGRGAHQHHH